VDHFVLRTQFIFECSIYGFAPRGSEKVNCAAFTELVFD
jgi:hypothetical protein